MPDATGGAHGWLLRGDAKLLQIRWLVESIMNPDPGEDKNPANSMRLYKRAWMTLATLLPGLNDAERRRAALEMQEIALWLWRAKSGASRTLASRQDRYALVVSYPSSKPHCWICGFRFEDRSVDAFLSGRAYASTAHPFVDFLYPRGRNAGDLSIAIDHVFPVAAGGSGDLDNLRLSCSWCNRSKSSILDLYASTTYRADYKHPEFGWLSLPNYGWASRVLALSGACSKCGLSQGEGELVLAAPATARRINPTCLLVYCRAHDPWHDNRMVPAGTVPR
ncbi:HNH endonuclease [Streptomyces cellulosae]|uniref:HNH endonuclease n=1 Tax=unclassified Streptomyces TaxID=2593676 RepID=UPI0009962B53